ncbi:MAG: beta-glucosidase [Paraglaciecola sp.]|nr:beta-glucosidase [Paraglaciecola sp.]NCT46431.1 beta-glucosidase [Paraglaciecola sp.]
MSRILSQQSVCVTSLLLLAACATINNTTSSVAYLDTSLSFEQRVDDLVSRMTTSEKIAQMYNDAPAIERLGVPAYDYWNEALHGVARAGKATVFPQAIGMAAMWDEDLMLDVATAISDEGRAKHHFFVENDVHYRYTGLTFWSPNINIFRDPRWGRGQETYGEDPYLTGELAVQFIHGLQGDDPKYLKTAATAKHFAVHNGPEISRHSDNYVVSNKDLYETYMPAFEKAIVDADVEAVMCAYNRVNGQPACGSDLLLKDILRGQFKFNGHVMSDCGAIADFYDPNAHNVVQAPAVAAAWAVTAGTDLNCGTGRLSTFANLNFALQKELISEDLIDQAVQRLFMTRFKLGMFDPKQDVSYANIPTSVVGSPEHLALAQKATESSLVLLKNDGLLPLKKGIKVAVIGPNADNEDVLLGNYNGIPIAAVTPLQGISSYLGADQVSYAPGSAIIADVYGHYRTVGPEYFFHQNANNALVSGLEAKYYHVSHPKITDFTNLRPSGEMVGEPVLSRVDDNIDFYWERSPIDDKVMSDFAVVWQGILVPPNSGNYRFDGAVDISIDGQAVQGSVKLKAGQHYAFKASRIFLKNPWSNTIPTLTLRWLNESQNLVDEALAQAKNADVMVVVVGISPRIEGEEMPVKLDGFNYGDREDIDLPDEQQNLIKALHKLGKPMVLVNFSGSAVALNWENDNLNAIVQAFYPGEATGTALARLLWGEYSPSGRLPITFYKNLAGFAAFDDYAMENRTYKYFAGEVLYPFGYGLSYGDFHYSNLQAPTALSAGQDLSFSVDVSNVGDMDSAEVTQVYVSMPDAPVRVPQLELAGFQHHDLAKREQHTLHFTLTAKQLSYVDNDGIHQPYVGKLLLSVGSGQPKYLQAQYKQQAVVTLN